MFLPYMSTLYTNAANRPRPRSEWRVDLPDPDGAAAAEDFVSRAANRRNTPAQRGSEQAMRRRDAWRESGA